MEILAARGNIAEALRVYEQLRTLLREELGATPSPPIQALQLQMLKAAGPA
jgi:DNA-binding SARP family transcriptional activator